MAAKAGASILQGLLDKGVGLLPGDKKRPVVIHFDVNRTIIQIDPAGGKALRDVLNNNLASVCCGTVALNEAKEAEAEVPPWVAVKGPNDPMPDTAALKGKTLMTYDVYVDDHVVPSVPKEKMEGLSTTAAYDLWDAMSKKRRVLKNSFSDPGQPGAVYHGEWEALHKAMTLEHDSSKTHFIIPSVWECVNALSLLSWPFSVVFRTFGNDGPEILREWEKFVMGGLEVAPQGPMLSALKADYAAQKEKDAAAQLVQSGCLYRCDQGSFLQWGPPIAAKIHKQVDEAVEDAKVDGDALAELRRKTETELLDQQKFIKVTPNDLYNLMAVAPQASEGAQTKPQVLALVDFYPWWSQHREAPSGGKVFPVVLPQAGLDGGPFQVFFDDNIDLSPAETSIVDIKEASSGSFVGERHVQERYLCQAKPYAAILQRDYFVSELGSRLEAQHLAESKGNGKL